MMKLNIFQWKIIKRNWIFYINSLPITHKAGLFTCLALLSDWLLQIKSLVLFQLKAAFKISKIVKNFSPLSKNN